MEQSVSLRKRAIVGLTQFIVLLAVLLCLSSWSLRYWQGWIFWFVFSAAVTVITVYFMKRDPALIERRLKAGPAAELRNSQKIIQAFANVFFIALVFFPGLDHRFGWSQLSPWMVIAGDLMVLLGLYIVFLVFRENTFTSGIVEVGKDQAVISTGPYSYVRHPMYAGALILLFGIPLSLGSSWGLLFGLPMIAVIVWRLIDEEKFLATNLSGYAEYRAKTPYRLIPRVY
jgi:protein-S-isoprenylcysteine O-methyltransferase Ste14